MKVYFLENVVHVAKAWEIKDVKPGYAQNMLFPKKLAVELTPQLEKELKEKKLKEEKHKRELIENRHKIAEMLNNTKFVFKAKTDNSWKMFWWIWEKDILKKIKQKFKLELTKKHIDMPEGHLKKLWEHQIFIKLWKDAMAKIFITIEAL